MAQPHYGDHQLQIYQAGLKGARPRIPVRMEDLESAAQAVLSKESYWYVAGGAGESTMNANRSAFDRYRLHPRMLTDVSERDLSVTLFDRTLPSPLLLAPIGVQSIIRPEAELATARAAASLNVPTILSTVSAHSMESVADAVGDAPRWYQLYWPRSPELAASFVQRAERAGYEAVVVTLDTKMMAWRARDLQNAFLPFLNGQGLANYTSDPWFRDGLARPPEEDIRPSVQRWGEQFAAPFKTWKDLATLREATNLPILVKGVLHPDDARLALEHGVDGIIVSNHGGRQVDGSIAAIDALPDVATMVAGRVPVLFDSGIRTGSDVLKAKALGADAVLLGRPYIWGLALDGEDGVREVIKRVLADVDLTMALAGKARFSDVDRSLLVD